MIRTASSSVSGSTDFRPRLPSPSAGGPRQVLAGVGGVARRPPPGRRSTKHAIPGCRCRSHPETRPAQHLLRPSRRPARGATTGGTCAACGSSPDTLAPPSLPAGSSARCTGRSNRRCPPVAEQVVVAAGESGDRRGRHRHLALSFDSPPAWQHAPPPPAAAVHQRTARPSRRCPARPSVLQRRQRGAGGDQDGDVPGRRPAASRADRGGRRRRASPPRARVTAATSATST